ncbi:MAG: JAB domain-containing protein, partial [Culicoidibacterales bacterium]
AINIQFLDTKNRIVKTLGVSANTSIESVTMKKLFDEIRETNAISVGIYIPRPITKAERIHLEQLTESCERFQLNMIDIVQLVDKRMHSFKQNQYFKETLDMQLGEPAPMFTLQEYTNPNASLAYKRKHKENLYSQLNELYPQVDEQHLKKIVETCQKLSGQQREHFVCFDITENEVVPRIVFVGSKTTIHLDRFEVLNCVEGTKGIILAHNHPSGDFEPSDHDIAATRMLSQMAKELDLTIYDHLVVGQCGLYSIAEHNRELELPKTTWNCQEVQESVNVYDFCQLEDAGMDMKNNATEYERV